jgi:hypothetical protein
MAQAVESYGFEHTLQILKNFIVPESQDLESLTAEPFISLMIFGTFIFLGVLAAVYFYDQAFFKGDKINDIFPNGRLSPEFYTFYVLAFQMKPKAIFSISRPFPEDS